jgi:hypothetical protein
MSLICLELYLKFAKPVVLCKLNSETFTVYCHVIASWQGTKGKLTVDQHGKVELFSCSLRHIMY